MSQRIVFFFIVATTVILSSCMHVHRLSDDDLAWISMYNENDTIVYQGIDDGIDTIIIERIAIDSIDTSIPINENYIFSDYYCGCSVTGLFIHNTQKQDISFSVFKINNDDLELKMFVGQSYGCDTIYNVKDIYTQKKLIIFDLVNDSDKLDNTVSLRKIKWVKNKGVTEYSLFDCKQGIVRRFTLASPQRCTRGRNARGRIPLASKRSKQINLKWRGSEKLLFLWSQLEIPSTKAGKNSCSIEDLKIKLLLCN